jgi:hypothetical protein
VRDEVRVDAFRCDLHRLDRDVDLVGAHRHSGFVHLDDLAAGLHERFDLFAELAR